LAGAVVHFFYEKAEIDRVLELERFRGSHILKLGRDHSSEVISYNQSSVVARG